MSSPLGRGLGAIIPPLAGRDVASNVSNKITPSIDKQPGERIMQISVTNLKPNPHQARQVFDHGALEELVASIRQHGILVPLVVTPAEAGNYYIVAGERRWRAAQMMPLATVPAIIRDAGELERLELGLIENIQREDLNPLELSAAYQKLIDEFSLTQDQVAERVGKARSSVGNILRLLNLPEPIKKALADNKITFGHAKFLLSVTDAKKQQQMFTKIMEEQLSVRAATLTGEEGVPVKAHRRRMGKHPALEELEQKIQESLGNKVRIRPSGLGGEVIITYYDAEELRRLSERLIGS